MVEKFAVIAHWFLTPHWFSNAGSTVEHIKTIERVDPWYFPFMVGLNHGLTQVMRIPNKKNAKQDYLLHKWSELGERTSRTLVLIKIYWQE
jgi:hypothetical protein